MMNWNRNLYTMSGKTKPQLPLIILILRSLWLLKTLALSVGKEYLFQTCFFIERVLTSTDGERCKSGGTSPTSHLCFVWMDGCKRGKREGPSGREDPSRLWRGELSPPFLRRLFFAFSDAADSRSQRGVDDLSSASGLTLTTPVKKEAGKSTLFSKRSTFYWSVSPFVARLSGAAEK